MTARSAREKKSACHREAEGQERTRKQYPTRSAGKKNSLPQGNRRPEARGKDYSLWLAIGGRKVRKEEKCTTPREARGKKTTCRRRPEGQERRQNDALREAQGKKYIYDGPRMEEKPLHRTKRKEKYGQPLNEL